jgi:hypothetical protein
MPNRAKAIAHSVHAIIGKRHLKLFARALFRGMTRGFDSTLVTMETVAIETMATMEIVATEMKATMVATTMRNLTAVTRKV